MKSILRSPIEPEFAYFLKTTFRKKKEALVGRFQSARARLVANLAKRKRTALEAIESVRQRIQTWKAEYREKYRVARLKRLKKPIIPLSKTPSDSANVSRPNVPLTPSLAPSLDNLRKKFKGLDWKFRLERRSVLVVIFVAALIAGMGLKTMARDSITIGFEDYKLNNSGQMIDLNEVQKRVLSGDTGSAGTAAYAGEQCTE